MAFFSILGVSILLVLLGYRYFLYPAFLSPLSRIPNAHITVSVCPLWMWWKRRGGREGTRSIFAAHRQKGPIVRLGPKEVSVASVDGLRQIYAGGFMKPKWYAEQFMHYRNPNLVSMVSPTDHAERRRALSHVYSKSHLLSSRDMRLLSDAIIFKSLFPILEVSAQRQVPVDFYQLNRAIGSDFMSAYLFGLPNSTNTICDARERRDLFRDTDALLRSLTSGGKVRQVIEARGLQLCQAASELVRHPSLHRKLTQPSTEPVVFASLHNRLPKVPEANDAIDSGVLSEMLDHFLAGPEGTKTTLTFLQWELSKQPSLQARLRQELSTLSPAMKPTSRTQADPSGRQATRLLPSFQALDALPLLDAIVQESLRVYPASQAPQFRITPPGGCTIEQHFHVPGGVLISTAVFCMHRNEDVFSNAWSWEPERWMQEDAARLEEMKRWFWAFGSGPRTCIGRHFVALVMKIVVAAIYTNYTTAIIDDDGMEQADTFLGHPIGEKLVLELSAQP
ncbi:cytochrome P450 3A12 [Paraphaeosphaeria sporulosa]